MLGCDMYCMVLLIGRASYLVIREMPMKDNTVHGAWCMVHGASYLVIREMPMKDIQLYESHRIDHPSQYCHLHPPCTMLLAISPCAPSVVLPYPVYTSWKCRLESTISPRHLKRGESSTSTAGTCKHPLICLARAHCRCSSICLFLQGLQPTPYGLHPTAYTLQPTPYSEWHLKSW